MSVQIVMSYSCDGGKTAGSIQFDSESKLISMSYPLNSKFESPEVVLDRYDPTEMETVVLRAFGDLAEKLRHISYEKESRPLEIEDYGEIKMKSLIDVNNNRSYPLVRSKIDLSDEIGEEDNGWGSDEDETPMEGHMDHDVYIPAQPRDAEEDDEEDYVKGYEKSPDLNAMGRSRA
jgi:hypothetical protein